MTLQDPFAAYTPRNNLEAHLVCRLLRDAGIEAWAIEDLSSENGTGMGGVPQVWIERTDIERARPVLIEYDRWNAQRRVAEGGTHDAGARVEVVCEECGERSMFPAAQTGTTQSCPSCHAYVDVETRGGLDGRPSTCGQDEA
jgi:Putative prokaryotic signal transducing protein